AFTPTLHSPHRPSRHAPLSQSGPSEHCLKYPHLSVHCDQPQSTSVSSWFFSPSAHDGTCAAQSKALNTASLSPWKSLAAPFDASSIVQSNGPVALSGTRPAAASLVAGCPPERSPRRSRGGTRAPRRQEPRSS